MTAPLALLFALTPKDQASGLWGPWYMSFSGAAALAAFQITNLGLPPESALWIAGANVQGVPGAGQAVLDLSVHQRDAGGNTLGVIMQQRVNGAANESHSVTQRLDMVIPSDEISLTAIGTFDAGVAQNTLRLTMWGIATPQGNMVRF